MVLLIQVLNVDYLVGVVKKPNLGYMVDHHYVANLSTDAWPGWEDSIKYLENRKCFEQQDTMISSDLLQTLDHVRYESENNWHNLGAWNLSDAQALDFLQPHEDRLKFLHNNHKNC